LQLVNEAAMCLCFGLSSSAPSVTQATPELLDMAAEILGPVPAAAHKPLILADKEHCSQELFAHVRQAQTFDLLCAVPAHPNAIRRWRQVPAADFTEHWPGYATARAPCHFQAEHQTIVVTLYNAPNASLLQHHYEHLPEKSAREGVSPEIPWLYNFKLDFPFK
jgi:hypothetical protein